MQKVNERKARIRKEMLKILSHRGEDHTAEVPVSRSFILISDKTLYYQRKISQSEAKDADRPAPLRGPNALLRTEERRSRNTRSRHTYRICLPSTAGDDATTTKLCGI